MFDAMDTTTDVSISKRDAKGFVDVTVTKKLDREVTITLTRDGNMICALIGENLQEGTAGFGATISEALQSLAAHIDDDILPSQY